MSAIQALRASRIVVAFVCADFALAFAIGRAIERAQLSTSALKRVCCALVGLSVFGAIVGLSMSAILRTGPADGPSLALLLTEFWTLLA
jgi:hypothetical protein